MLAASSELMGWSVQVAESLRGGASAISQQQHRCGPSVGEGRVCGLAPAACPSLIDQLPLELSDDALAASSFLLNVGGIGFCH